MPFYSYVAYDIHGAKLQAEVEASSIDVAKEDLRDAGFTLVEIKPSITASSKGSLNKKLSVKELEFFTSQLALLLNNGLRLDNSLHLLRKTSTSEDLKVVCAFLAGKVREGISLSVALKEVKSFDNVYTSLVSVGESAGNLPEVLTALSVSLKFHKQLTQKVGQAIAYPMMILIVCVLAVVFIFNFVIPRMSTLFEGMEELPWYTELMLGATEFFVKYQWIMLGLIVLTIFGVKTAFQTNPVLARKIEQFFINIPGLNQAFSLVERIRYSETLAMTLSNGLPLERGMQLAMNVLKVTKFQTQALSAKEDIKQGIPLSQTMSKCSFFNETYVGLIEVGETSGNLDVVFEEIAARSRDDFDNWVTKFTSLLEPLLILIMAAIVGTVVITMLMSIISVQDIGF